MTFNHSLPMTVWLTAKILAAEGLASGPFGNISVRDFNSTNYWINPSGLTFEDLTPEDIIKVDSEGNVIYGDREAHPGEFIHREIYRLRSDVKAIVHTHSENTVNHSLLGCEIEPFTQLGAAFYNDQAIYQGFTGPVRTQTEGEAIAKALGQFSLVIAKNHGFFATGPCLEAALWDFIVADLAAKTHLKARVFGLQKADKLSPECMQKSKIEVREKQYNDMWLSYLSKIDLSHKNQKKIKTINF